MMQSRTISVSIALPPRQVYAFASNPENLPQWAPAFCKSVGRMNGEWVVETPDGPMTIQFQKKNEFGILDHTVRLPSGVEIVNPMRVISNGAGSEVIFTLFRAPDMTEQKFAEDAKWVECDLHTLKRILESAGPQR